MVKIKAILYDLDGVLIEAKDWHYEALNKALGLFGMEISRYDHLVTYDGLPTKYKLKMLTLESGLPKALHSFIYDMKQQYTQEIIHTNCKPVFLHQYAISKLKKEGFKQAVCSNSIRPSVLLMLEKAQVLEHMDFFISNQDVKKAKPDPEMYQTAMKKLNLKPEECIILEDNEKGIKAAIASGAHLLKIDVVSDVTYDNIRNKIDEIEGESK